jgi:hypothetical protein
MGTFFFIKGGHKYLVLQSLGTIPLPFHTFHSCNWLNSLKLSYTTDTFSSSNQFGIHCNQLSHSEAGGSAFLRNIVTFNYYTLQEPQRGLTVFNLSVHVTYRLTNQQKVLQKLVILQLVLLTLKCNMYTSTYKWCDYEPNHTHHCFLSRSTLSLSYYLLLCLLSGCLLMFYTQNSVNISRLPHVPQGPPRCHGVHPSHHSNNVWQMEQIIQLLIPLLFPFGSNIPLGISFFLIPQSMLFPHVNE